MHTLNIQLIATDMDGTLLDSNKQLPPDFMDWVRSHPQIQTVIASGRQYYNLREQFLPITDSLIYIADNGGLVFEKDSIVYCNRMSDADLTHCIRLFDNQPDIYPILCGAKSAYMRHASTFVEQNAHMYYAHLAFTEDLYSVLSEDEIVKIALFVDHGQAETVYRNFPELPASLVEVLSGDSWIDIANASVSKGAALTSILERLAIPRSNAMAFGDYLNDYTLLQCCDESYAMENAHPKLKEIARHITASNDAQGVMRVLHTL